MDHRAYSGARSTSTFIACELRQVYRTEQRITMILWRVGQASCPGGQASCPSTYTASILCRFLLQAQLSRYWHTTRRCYLSTYRGKRSIDLILITLSTPLSGEDLWDAGTPYGHTLIYPLRFNTMETRGICSFRDTRASASIIRETCEGRFEPVSSTASNVKVLLPTELWA